MDVQENVYLAEDCNNERKNKIAYWGAGNIGKICLEQHPSIRPDFFIDSNWKGGRFCGIEVKRPKEIECWDDLWIVITTMSAEDEIENLLNTRGLERFKNYTGYKDFFGTGKKNLEEQIAFLADCAEKRKYKEVSLIVAPVFIARGSKKMIPFFRQYGRNCGSQCILLSDLGVTSKTYAQNTIGYPVFELPDIGMWEGGFETGEDYKKDLWIHGELLTDSERKWVRSLEEKKTYKEEALSYNITAELYWYVKQVFLILQPAKVIIWSLWNRLSFILEELAEQNNIPYGFMEYGWIPGTFRFQKDRVNRLGMCVAESDRLPAYDMAGTHSKMKKIRNYIIANKIDTRNFLENDDDERKIQKIDQTKKTVFLVGMDDYGMGINPKTEYWKRNVSPVVSSTKEAVFRMAEICKKNGWNFVFKPHPHTTINFKDCELEKSMVQVQYMEIDRLVQLADVVVSMISAVNYKALIYGKPLVQLGYTPLTKVGCSYEVSDSAMLEQQLKTALEKGMTKEQEDKFELHMAWLLENCLWDDLSDTDMRYGLSLDKDFFAISRGWKE